MTDLYADIFTEPEDVDPATLADLGSYFEATVLMVQGQPEPLEPPGPQHRDPHLRADAQPLDAKVGDRVSATAGGELGD